MMFRCFAKIKVLPAFFIALSLLYNWAICTSACEEITEHHTQINEFAEKEFASEECLTSTHPKETCPINSTAVILQERQTVENHNIIAAISSGVIFHKPVVSWSALLPETKQNSPPRTSFVPIFLQLCTFRI